MIIELTVAYVGFGGNTGDGKYFYSYSPNTILVEEPDTTLRFQFSPETTANSFTMKACLTTDGHDQFNSYNKGPDGSYFTLMDNNTNTQLTVFSILVSHIDPATKKETLISCDPQVLNIPDIHDFDTKK